MPSHKKSSQYGLPKSVSAISLLTTDLTKPLLSKIKSQRISKTKPAASKRQPILKTLSLRRHKIQKNSKDQSIKSDNESSYICTTMICSSDMNNQEEEVTSQKSNEVVLSTTDSSMSSQPEPSHRFYTDHVLMVEPTAFYINEETIEDNKFMQRVKFDRDETSRIALKQFNDMVDNLKRNNINVTIYKQQADNLPDSVFPDWFTTFRSRDDPNESVFFTYPMKTQSRQGEYNQQIVDELGANYACVEHHQPAVPGQSLEGKGSLVLDHKLRKVYCCISERACLETVQSFVEKLNEHCEKPYKLVAINSIDPVSKTPIYHTDVMFAMLDQHVVCCLEAIADSEQRSKLMKEMGEGGRTILDISYQEMTQMCGNMVQVKDSLTGELCILMSQKARDGLSEFNRNELERCYRIVSSDISMIETIGGGSARCMTIELF